MERDSVDRDMAQPPERIDYSLGDYSFISRIFQPSSEALVDAAGVSTGMRVLDVAAGDGNTAVAAARRGAVVTALDITPSQVERGRKRTKTERLSVEWIEGDAEHLPFPDGSFDCALCTFGLERDQVAALSEMVRIVLPGGRIGITDWTNEGLIGALWNLELRDPFTEIERKESAFLGDEDYVQSLLEPHASEILTRRDVIRTRYESVDRFCAELWMNDPEMRAVDRLLDADQRRQFLSRLRRLVTDYNTATDGTLRLELNYLLTLARRRSTTDLKSDG